jgi:hypothetical protein
LQREVERLRAQYGSSPINHTPLAALGEQTNQLPDNRSTWNPESNTNQYPDLLHVDQLPDTTAYSGVSPRLEQLVSAPSVASISMSRTPADDNLIVVEGPHRRYASTAFSPSVGTSSIDQVFTEYKESTTISQRLGGLKLSARKIDGCFSMFVFSISAKIPVH